MYGATTSSVLGRMMAAAYGFVSARTHDGRSVRLLNLIDEHTRESLLCVRNAVGPVPGSSLRWLM